MFPNLIDAISASAALLVATVTVIVAVLTYFRRGKIKFGNMTLDFSAASTEMVLAKKDLPQTLLKPSPADKQFVLLKEYHSQGLAQSKISFWFSLIFAALGFAVIIIAILTMDKGIKFTDQARTFVSLVAGTVIEAVSALFFVQSNKARQLMIEFFDKLRADRKLEESLRLANELPDPVLQSRLKIILALNFADRKSADEFLCSVLNVDQQLQRRAPDMADDPSAKAKA
jgi:hypothetical protein